MNAVFFITTGSEDAEVVATLDMLRRAKINTTLVSLLNEKSIRAAHGVQIVADALFEEIDYNPIQAMVIPGGGTGVELMMHDERLLSLIKDFHQKGKLIGAICAAPAILEKAGVLSEQTPFTCYPTWGNLNQRANYLNEGVVETANIITAKSVNFAIAFGLKLVERIAGIQAREQVEKSIYYNS